jgi:hypothetical protein
MKKRTWIVLATAVLILGAIIFFGAQRWGGRDTGLRADVLAQMPAGASAVLYADFAELRESPFIAELYAWAPKPQADAEYAQFLRDTGFDYERDLDRLSVAVLKRGEETKLFAIADGRFDQKKIAAYASQMGTNERRDGREVFSVPVSGRTRRISFTFIRRDRIVLTDDADLAPLITSAHKDPAASEWQEKFERLAGSPVFAVIRQDAMTGAALAQKAPGGLRSPQLSALLDQLQWISLAGKPEGDHLRVVAEGECSTDTTVRQLGDLLNGVIVLAQAGLNDSKTRQQLDPQAREAYLELLRSADVSRIDRGDGKSVRLVFAVTPKFLQAARTVAPIMNTTPAGGPKQDSSIPRKQ